MLLLLVAFAPSVLLLGFFYAADRYEPEPRAHVAAAVALGAVGTLLALGVARGLEAALGTPQGGLASRVYEAFVLEGMAEEGTRWLLLVSVIYRWEEFDEPMDGVLYGVAVALGFGTVENVLYVMNEGLRVGVLRAVFAVPEHALLGATMGGFLGMAKLGHGLPARRRGRVALALLVPILLHGSYDLGLLVLVGPAMYAAVAVGSVVLWVIVLRRVRSAQERSPFRPVDGRGPGGDLL